MIVVILIRRIKVVIRLIINRRKDGKENESPITFYQPLYLIYYLHTHESLTARASQLGTHTAESPMRITEFRIYESRITIEE